MSTGRDPSEPSMSEWSLEPLDAEPAAATVAEPVPTPSSEPQSGPSKFHADSRGQTDRRKSGDRRETLRFEPDRRSGMDRRPRKGWEPGKNI
jgi:hypothetical protein